MPRYIKVESAAPSPRTARYSHAVEFNGLLHITGQLPIDPKQPDAALPATIGEQADLVFLNLSIIAEESGFSLSNCVFARIYLRNFEQDYAGFNAVYDRYFPDADRLPARTTVGVAMLGRNALVEVDLLVGQPRS
ncbi:putative translation initiation inhibitor, yjgF family [Mesorhizobium plurifarium]|uniref:Putative translation initiation inhibitor, yjgF family n=1 Tax=Mesorhizobium plurifarium TaxID=69974 RepID=A0A0K2VR31_MESPL|nr:putative translation initiation inhibitor, yjgF family [Mesorhizobium plurifarium]